MPANRFYFFIFVHDFLKNDARAYFSEVKQIYDKYAGSQEGRIDFQYLSMGMTNDFEVGFYFFIFVHDFLNFILTDICNTCIDSLIDLVRR